MKKLAIENSGSIQSICFIMSLMVLIIGLLIHEYGHLIYLMLNGCGGTIQFGYLPSVGGETFYIDVVGDMSNIDTTMLALSGGFFAGLVIILLSIKFRWMLWVGLFHLYVGFYEAYQIFDYYTILFTLMLFGIILTFINGGVHK